VDSFNWVIRFIKLIKVKWLNGTTCGHDKARRPETGSGHRRPRSHQPVLL